MIKITAPNISKPNSAPLLFSEIPKDRFRGFLEVRDILQEGYDVLLVEFESEKYLVTRQKDGTLTFHPKKD